MKPQDGRICTGMGSGTSSYSPAIPHKRAKATTHPCLWANPRDRTHLATGQIMCVPARPGDGTHSLSGILVFSVFSACSGRTLNRSQ